VQPAALKKKDALNNKLRVRSHRPSNSAKLQCE